ncbi:MAG: glycoside hydrolase family 3 N-terminal domain-containing protein [Leptonema sp. (in: bacteria)]
MKFKLYIFIFLIFFCNLASKKEKISFYDFPFSFETKISYFLWQNLYKNQYQNTIEDISKGIANQLPIYTKIAQLIHIGISGKEINNSIIDIFKEVPLGGVILFKSNIESKEQVELLINDLQNVSLNFNNLPLFFSVDQEGGRVQRIDFISDFPSAMAVGQTGKIEYPWLVGFITGYETSNLGIHLVFAPVADINNNPKNPVINTRSFGTTKEIVSKMVVNYIGGISLSNSIGFLKHFPGHGDTNIDSHHQLPQINKDIEELMSFELVPFIHGIENQALGIMIGHILFPKIDVYPSSLSKVIITDLLKQKLKFKGMVITDAMEMKAATNNFPIEDASLKSLQAGADIILLTAQNENFTKIFKKLKEKYETNELTEERINEAVTKQIKYKLYCGLFDINLLKKYTIEEKTIHKYRKLFEYKKKLADKIYQDIKEKYPSLEEQISYDSIRSLQKDFPKIQNTIIKIFINDPIYKETIEKNIEKNHIYVFEKKEFYLKNFTNEDMILYEVSSINEWNQISKLDLKYKILVGMYTGNPFENIMLKDNQYLIVSFSPTRTSKKALLKKILLDSVKKSEIALPESE